MSVKDDMDKGRKIIEAVFLGGDVNALDELYTPDCVLRTPPFPDINGLTAIKRATTEMRKIATIQRIDWEEEIIEGDTAANRYTIHLKLKNGQDISLHRAAFLHWKDGKVAEEILYQDYSAILQLMGNQQAKN